MTLDTSYPQSAELCVDPKQRIGGSSVNGFFDSRFSSLSVLLVASLVLHLSFLTALDLLDTAQQRPDVPDVIPVELVTEPPPKPKDKPQPSKKLPAKAQNLKSAATPETKPEAKQDATPAQKPEAKSETKPESKTEAKPPADSAAKPELKPEPKPESKPPQADAPKPQAEKPPAEKPAEQKLAAAKAPAAPRSSPPSEPKSAAKPPPADVKSQPAEAKPAASQPLQQTVPPWEQPPSQAAASSAQQNPAMNLPIDQQAQQAVAVPMPSADGDVPMSYETIVSGKLALARRFPPEARARGAHGAAMVDFLIDLDGKVSKIKLLKSSGDAALDVESLAMVMRAAPFPPPPPGAEREFAIMVDFDPKQ